MGRWRELGRSDPAVGAIPGPAIAPAVRVSLPIRTSFLIPLIAATMVILALVLAQDQETIRVVSAMPVEDERYPAYVAALVGADLTRGNAYEVLTNGNEIFPAMLEAIDGARRRISFETYIYEPGDVANKFTAALEYKTEPFESTRKKTEFTIQ